MTTSAPIAPARRPTDHVYFSMTKGLCGSCKRAVDVKIQFRAGKVWFDKFCPEHGHQQCMVASSVEWYLDALSFVAPNDPPKGALKPVEAGHHHSGAQVIALPGCDRTLGPNGCPKFRNELNYGGQPTLKGMRNPFGSDPVF